MKTSLILIEGVIRNLIGGAPISEGVRLYRSLCSTGWVMLVSLVDSDTERDEMQRWLDLNGLVGHDQVSWNGIDRVSLANGYRREGYDIDMVVDPDPVTAGALIEAGFNTMLFVHSQYAHPSWRPDARKGVQPWASITHQVAQMARMKAQDARLRDTE